MTDERPDQVRSTDIRTLRRAVLDLADTVEMLVEEMDQKSNGQGPPEHAQSARNRAQEVRERTPAPVRDEDAISPPWEREGYESKEEWLEDRGL